MLEPLCRHVLAAAFVTSLPIAAHAQSTAPAAPIAQDTPALQPEPVFAQPTGTVVYLDPYGQPIYAAAPQPAPQAERLSRWAPMRATIGVSASVLVFSDSSFRQASRAWGYNAFDTAPVIALDGGVHVNPFILLGARVAFGGANGGSASYDHAALSMDMFDADAIARFGAPVRLGRSWVFFPGAQFELGALWASMHLRGQSNSALLARVAGEAIAMFASPHVGLSARVGYQFSEWDHTDGNLTLMLSGFTAGVGLEVRL
jgi:hypothetical protein